MKATIEEAERILDKMGLLEASEPMEAGRQAFFQQLCAKEAERLRYFLTKPLTKKARADVEHWERIFSTAAIKKTVIVGASRSVAPFMGRTLTAYREGEVQSYRRRPKGKIYERL